MNMKDIKGIGKSLFKTHEVQLRYIAVAGVPTQPSKRIESGRFRGHSPNGIEDEKEEQVEQEEEEEEVGKKKKKKKGARRKRSKKLLTATFDTFFTLNISQNLRIARSVGIGGSIEYEGYERYWEVTIQDSRGTIEIDR
ncbi:hypothetical protein PV325_007760 [Microctonus aethiopoides]|nr:hypothetical protein PV325_007760 [Microctonus aethiopoides]